MPTDVSDFIGVFMEMNVDVALCNTNTVLTHEADIQPEFKLATLHDIVEVLNNSTSLNSLIFTLTQTAQNLIGCDRCTLYLIDRSRLNASLVVMSGDVELRIPMQTPPQTPVQRKNPLTNPSPGRESMSIKNATVPTPSKPSLAVVCAQTESVVNIQDCYSDPRFNTEIDAKTGYRTRSMLCLPIPGQNTTANILQSEAKTKSPNKSYSKTPYNTSHSQLGQNNNNKAPTIGVLQLINKNNEMSFTANDEATLSTLLAIAGPILDKYNMFTDESDTMNQPTVMGMDNSKKSPPAPSIPQINENGQLAATHNSSKQSSDHQPYCPLQSPPLRSTASPQRPFRPTLTQHISEALEEDD